MKNKIFETCVNFFINPSVKQKFPMPNIFVSVTLISVYSLSLASADSLKFEAVWSSGSGSNIVSEPLNRSAFIARGEKLTGQGLRLIDVESEIVNGIRKYTGLWVNGNGSNLFDGPLSPIKLREVMKKKRDQGLRLVDFELFRRPNGGRRYLAVWRPGQGTEILTGPMTEKAFLSRGEKLTKDGLRLKDVEVERINGQSMYSGLFQTGSGTNLLTTPLTRNKFIKKRDEFVAKGIELVDVERVLINGSNLFVGVWSSGTGESRLSLPRNFKKFVTFGIEQTSKGFRTKDMELRLSKTSEDPSDPGPGPNPVNPNPVLPNLPVEISLTSGSILTVDFTLLDGHVQLQIPSNFLPDWLPRSNGQVVFPDAFCGFNLIRVGSIFWQIPGDSAVDDFPFIATNEVSDLEGDQFLGGVDFGGPIGACNDPTVPWELPFPFLAKNAPFFEPLPNMTLRVQFGSSDGKIRFKSNGTPNQQVLFAHELFTPDTYNALLKLLEGFDPAGSNTAYCDGVDDYFIQVCNETPGQCPVDKGLPPSC